MKEKLVSRLPLIFTYYTIIIIVTCTYNLFIGSTIIQTRWFLELFAVLVVYTILDQVFDYIDFKSYLTFVLAEAGAAYVLFLVFSYFFQWISFTPNQLLPATLLFAVIVAIGATYFNYRFQLRTKELNDLIKNQHKE